MFSSLFGLLQNHCKVRKQTGVHQKYRGLKRSHLGVLHII